MGFFDAFMWERQPPSHRGAVSAPQLRSRCEKWFDGCPFYLFSLPDVTRIEGDWWDLGSLVYPELTGQPFTVLFPPDWLVVPSGFGGVGSQQPSANSRC